ncbi:MAG: hypothetical protein OHK0013_49290 [Sandaracinaceae bacterium]
MRSEDLNAHLRTLGIDEALALALDATITPETLARASQSSEPTLDPSVGPLPRIALSGLPRGTQPPHATAPAPELADLEVVRLLGEGGMGRVHLARQRSLGREVAIKTLKSEVADVRAVELLRAEATTMGRLEHPNVVPVHAVGRDDAGQLVLVMKRIEGVAWRDLLRDPSHPRWAALAPRREDRLEVHLDVLAQVANALHFAHGRGIVHRDVKPENVLLGEHGEVYLADWGIAMRLGRTGPPELLGTPAYLAPEMVVGDPAQLDARTDVYLLGATLHEILTGYPPHDAPTLQAALLHAYESPPPTYGPDVPRELAAIATRAMAARREDRFESALTMRHALDARRRHAGAIALIRQAEALLAELGREDVDEAARASRDRRLTECRFAFVQALRTWPESDEARAGLDAVLVLAVRHELARENAHAARALLAERSSTDTALEAEVVALEARLAARRADAERLRALEDDADLRVGLRSRVATFGVVTATALGISLYVQLRPGPLEPTVTVGIALALAALVIGGLAVFRRHLLRNAAGRRVGWLLAASAMALVGHRVVAVAHGVGTSAILATDLVLFALVGACAGLLVPRAAWSALVPLAAAAATLRWPEHVATLFSVAGVLTLLAIGGLWLWEVRTAPR